MKRFHKFLLLVVVIVTMVGPLAGQEFFQLSTGEWCGMEGNAISSTAKELNQLKNRYVGPGVEDINEDVTLAALLEPGYDLERFDVGNAAVVSGVVVDVKVGGKETCNCKSTASIDRDTHIELAFDVDAPKSQRFIVEISPRWRTMKESEGLDWTTHSLRSELVGKTVEVTGWLFFDTMHIEEAENTTTDGSRVWRATCWELHPVTDFVVTDEFPPDNFSAVASLQQVQMATRTALINDPVKFNEIAARNKAILEQFDPSELDEGPSNLDQFVEQPAQSLAQSSGDHRQNLEHGYSHCCGCRNCCSCISAREQRGLILRPIVRLRSLSRFNRRF